MEQRKRLDLALGAHIRTMLGWSRNLPERERKQIATRATKLIKSPDGCEWEAEIAANATGTKGFIALERQALREMSKLAASLPVWVSFGRGVRGFGEASLAVIAAEAGDLSLYSNPAKLWKRMGLAVMDGVRQGGLAKNAGADAWIAHGYSRQRRSRMWNIGDALIKGNKGEYREIYLARKAYEFARDPEMKPIKVHRRAQRFMEKRLLRNLWRAWRQAMGRETPAIRLPAVSLSAEEAERSAKPHLPSNGRVPGAFIPDAADEAAERQASFDMPSLGCVPAAHHSADEAERSASTHATPSVPLPGALNLDASQEARQANTSMSPDQGLPAAFLSAREAERSAETLALPIVRLPSAPDAADEAAERRARLLMTPSSEVPAASLSALQAEPPATTGVPTARVLPAAPVPDAADEAAERRAIVGLPPDSGLPAASPSALQAEPPAKAVLSSIDLAPAAPKETEAVA